MIVQILKDIFEDGSHNVELDRLWSVIEEPHFLYLKDEDEIDVLMNSSWYLGLRKTSKEIIFDLIVGLLQSSENIKPRIIISNFEGETFSIYEAIRFLNQPFSLILENSYNDSVFFNSLLKNFPKQSKTLIHHKENGWFNYEMGGGSTIKDTLRTKMDSFDTPKFTKEKFKYLRCFVLIDSDRKYPEEGLKKEIQSLIEFLSQNEVPYHILEKREMENYLPDEALSEITDNRIYVDFYLRLSPIQKDYFDMEKGFEAKFDQLASEIQDLYCDIDDLYKQVFRNNNLKRINNCQRENFKSDFPLFFLSDKVNRENLLLRCSHHSNHEGEHPFDPFELPNLLKQISSIL